MIKPKSINEEDYNNYFIECKPNMYAKIIHCKECKYYNKENGRCDHPNLDWDIECYDLWLNMNPNDFCSKGKEF